MNLPAPFVARMQQLLGKEDYQHFCNALQESTPVSVRMNQAKCLVGPKEGRAVAWCSSGYYLPQRPTFTFDPLFHAGVYYVQEASSMFIEQAMRTYVDHPVVMLDLCAAPGGKSTLCRSVLPEGSFLVANEVMRNRSQILAENLIKWGDAGVAVTSNDPADFASLGPVFDVMLTDVPCSGEGMFRKEQVAIDEWSLANVDLCSQRQRRILADVWSALKPGGLLIYSTCTYNIEENEENVAWIARQLGADVLPLDVPQEWNVTGNLAGTDFPVYRFLPHRIVGEGLFMAILRKHEDGEICVSQGGEVRKKKDKGGKCKEKKLVVPEQVKQWLQHSEQWQWLDEEGVLRAVPQAYAELYQSLRSNLKVLHAGVTVAELKGKDWSPHHSLAMSSVMDSTRFPVAEISYEQAIAYLRKEVIVLSSDMPKGMVLLQYEDLPLGFVKNIGNRANNLYPQEWRIRSGYLPEEVQLLK